MTKKITFLISSLSGGGAEGVCVNIANGLASRGWQVELVVLHMKHSVYHDRLDPRVSFVVLGINHARYSPFGLARYLLIKRPQKILIFNYELVVVAVVLKKLLWLDTKIIARNINTLSHKRKQVVGVWQKYIVKLLIERFYSKADHIINQCEAMREDLLTIYPDIKDKTSVIYNPINSIVQEHAKQLDFEKMQKQEYVLCVGRLEKQKAFHYAIESFAMIASDFPHLRLKIVGKGSLEAQLKQKAKELNVSDRVDFEGFQSDIIPYYVGAKATLLTSLYEGFPNVLIESIALGTPVVAFDCQSGPSEIVQDDINGYLVEHQNIEGFASKLRALLSKEWDYAQVAKSGDRFSVDSIIDAYEKRLKSSNLMKV